MVLNASVQKKNMQVRQQRKRTQLRRELQRQWWHSYGREIVAQCPGARLFAIGKTVADTLGDIKVPLVDWVYQPQAARGAALDMERGWAALLAAVAAPPDSMPV